MSEARASDGKYHVDIRDALGVVIGDNNVVYQYFLDERYRPLAEHLIAFDDLIAERTADFVGRAFLDARLASFMEQHDRGYFVLVGEPGIGKTAWAAHVVQEHGALHHFNVSAMGIVRPDQALENLCVQIIARFQLDQPFLPVNAGRDGSLLDKLLRRAAERLDGGKLVIVIDAMDEAQMSADVRGANALYLPLSLPPSIYFVLTRRPQPMLLETVPGTPLEVFTLGADLPDNQGDVRAYLRQQAVRREIAVRLADRHIPTARFIEELAERSAGNFMYLAYLLPDIAAGLLDPLNLTGLPQGLRGYYERFWNELESAKGEGREAWTKFYKPVIGMLAVAREPVSAAWIGRILGLDPDQVADFALARWRKFLYRTEVEGRLRWQVYHASFADFLAAKVDRLRFHRQIAVYYSKDVTRWPDDEGYAWRHLSAHLAEVGMLDELAGLIENQDWHIAQRHYDPSLHSYATDVERGLVVAEAQGLPALPKVVVWSLLYATLRTRATQIPLAALDAMAMLGQTERVFRYAALITDPRLQAEAYDHVARRLYLRKDRERACEALSKALVAAERVRTGSGRYSILDRLASCAAEIGELEQALTIANRIQDQEDRTRTLEALASELAWSGKLDEAIAACEHIEDESARVRASERSAQAFQEWTLNRFETLGERHLVRQALLLADGIEESPWRDKALAHLATGLTHANLGEKAYSVIGRIQDADIRLQALMDVAEALTRAGQTPKALLVLDQAAQDACLVEDHGIRSDRLCSVATALRRAGEVQRAEAVLKSALDAAGCISGPARRAQAEISLVEEHAEVGEVEQAWLLAANIQNENERARAFQRISRVLVQTGSLAQALDVAEQIAISSVRDEAVAQIAPALAGAGETAQALAVVQGIQSGHYRKAALLHVAEAFARIGTLGLALEVADRFESTWDRAAALAAIGKALVRSGQADLAWEVTADITGDMYRPLTDVAEAFSMAGQMDRALALLRRIEDVESREQAFHGMVDKLGRAGMVDQALTVAGQIQAEKIRARALSRLVEDLRFAQLHERALDVAMMMPDDASGTRAHTIAEVALSLAWLGKADKAQYALDQVLTVAEQGGDRNRSAEALAAVSKMLAETGDLERAESALTKAYAVANNLRLDDFSSRASTALSSALTEFAAKSVRAGRGEQASLVLDHITDERLRTEALGDLAQGLAAGGDTEGAFEAITFIKDDKKRAAVLVRTAQVLADAGDLKQAKVAAEEAIAVPGQALDTSGVWVLVDLAQVFAQTDSVVQALDAAAHIADPSDRAWAMAKLAEALAQHGRIEQASVVLERLQRLTCDALTHDDHCLYVEPLVEALWALIAIDRGEEAMTIAESVKHEDVRLALLARAAGALALAGEAEDALVLAGRIQDSFTYAEVIGYVARGLARAGNVEKALTTVMKMGDEWEVLQAEALVDIAESLAKADNVILARISLSKVLATIRQLGLPGLDRVRVLGAVAGALARVGEHSSARAVHEEALLVAGSVQDTDLRIEALGGVAAARTGQTDLVRAALEGALVAAREIRNDDWQARKLTDLARILADAGEVTGARPVLSEALRTAEDIPDANDRASRLRDIAGLIHAVTQAADNEISTWLIGAFRRARERGRDEILGHVSIFAPTLAKLGIICQTWDCWQRTELVLG